MASVRLYKSQVKLFHEFFVPFLRSIFYAFSFYIYSNISTEQMLYTESDLESTMDKIETINFHEEKEIQGVKFWTYNAGHVLGAAMFMIEIAGVKVRSSI